MATKKSSFICTSENGFDNYAIVKSNVQTLKFDVMDGDKVKEYKVDPKWLSTGTRNDGTKIYKFSTVVAVPAMRRPKTIAEFGDVIAEYAAAIEQYDSCETVTNRKGKVVKRVFLVASDSKGKPVSSIVDFLYERLLGAIDLHLQKQGQKRNRPKAIAAAVAEFGLTLPPAAEKKIRTEQEKTDLEDEMSDEEVA